MKDIDRYKCGCSYKGRCGEGGRLGGKEGDRQGQSEREMYVEKNIDKKNQGTDKRPGEQSARNNV